MQTLYIQTRQTLRQAGIESPDLEARWILKFVTGAGDAELITGGRAVEGAEAARVQEMVRRRLAGEPLSRIMGEREFRGLSFTVSPAVLDPRPDTETLIDAVLAHFKGRAGPRRILDLGTGSGCILITLLRLYPEASGVGVDVSREALAIAAGNAARHGVAERCGLMQGEWFDALRGESGPVFDLIVSNPPYIPSADIPNLDREVRNHDPILALDGGADGLDAYKKIFSGIKNFLSPGAPALFEIGISQAEDVGRLAVNAGFNVDAVCQDFGGVARVVKISTGEK